MQRFARSFKIAREEHLLSLVAWKMSHDSKKEQSQVRLKAFSYK
jgi:hypothetical protein